MDRDTVAIETAVFPTNEAGGMRRQQANPAGCLVGAIVGVLWLVGAMAAMFGSHGH